MMAFTLKYYVYLMPYTRGKRTCFYCGYTNDPHRREHEHWTATKDRHYQWNGKLRVVDGPFDTRALACRAEQQWKRKTRHEKALAYLAYHHFFFSHTTFGGV